MISVLLVDDYWLVCEVLCYVLVREEGVCVVGEIGEGSVVIDWVCW